MQEGSLQILIAMVCYMAVVIGIGIYFAKRSNQSSEDYFLGGRSLGPWVTAMSAEASDMSGWLLMGLPGVAYWCGLSDAAWTSIGLALGTYINWLLVAKRLRRYSAVAGDAITLPDFFSNRFHEKKKVIMTLSALFILIFFTVYASSCFVTCGKLFSTLFGASYQSMMIAGALFVVIYTFLGGFLAESASDFMQAVVMIFALTVILITGTLAAGGLQAVVDNAKNIPGFFTFFGIASPSVDASGIQQVANGAPVFGEAGSYGFLTIISTLSWGLGYFGMPHILLRFMAIREEKELNQSRRIATIWVVISMFIAVCIGIIGNSVSAAGKVPFLATSAESETIIIKLADLMSQHGVLLAVMAGIILSGILAATMSTADSQLLAAASSVSQDLMQHSFGMKMNQRTTMLAARATVIGIAIIGMVLAWDPNSSVFRVVSFAWAGFGAAFGPVMLFSLFWKRANKQGALAGMITGGAVVFIWKYLIAPMGGAWAIYELLPAFLAACIAIVIVSLATPAPEKAVTDTFDEICGK